MSALDRDRLAKLLGMLRADHDGEVVNAARAADRWPDIAMPAQPPRGPIEFCLSCPTVLTAWERAFLHSLRSQNYRPTPKQVGVLERILEKVHAAEGRG